MIDKIGEEADTNLGVCHALVGVASPPPMGVSAPGSHVMRCERRASCAAMAVSLSL